MKTTPNFLSNIKSVFQLVNPGGHFPFVFNVGSNGKGHAVLSQGEGRIQGTIRLCHQHADILQGTVLVQNAHFTFGRFMMSITHIN